MSEEAFEDLADLLGPALMGHGHYHFSGEFRTAATCNIMSFDGISNFSIFYFWFGLRMTCAAALVMFLSYKGSAWEPALTGTHASDREILEYTP